MPIIPVLVKVADFGDDASSENSISCRDFPRVDQCWKVEDMTIAELRLTGFTLSNISSADSTWKQPLGKECTLGFIGLNDKVGIFSRHDAFIFASCRDLGRLWTMFRLWHAYCIGIWYRAKISLTAGFGG